MIKAPHFSIMLALALVACAGNGPPPPANFAIQAHTRSVNATTFKVLVSGIAFSPGGQVAITYTNVPNRPGVQNGSLQATVEPDGTFNYVEDFNCTTNDPRDIGTVLVAAHDLASGHVALKNIPANAWLCQDH
jgi:hypothetical protein